MNSNESVTPTRVCICFLKNQMSELAAQFEYGEYVYEATYSGSERPRATYQNHTGSPFQMDYRELQK